MLDASLGKSRRRAVPAKLALGFLLGSGLAPIPASAQQVGPVGPEPATEADAQQLDEVVVTAQRREQRLQDVPVAVSAFDSATLRASGVANVRELTQVEPSLNVQYSAGVYSPFLRGIGNSAGGTVGNEASVPVYIDDLYYTRLSSAYLALGSIDRVEVLKGPQGTLFGRNSSGGAIQMFTRDPGDQARLDAALTYGNYDTVSGQLYASTPITETLGFNVALGGSDQRSGWGRNITTGRDAYLEEFATARAKLVWEPGAGTRLKLVGFYAYQKGDIGLTQDRHRGSYGSSARVPLPGYPNPPVVLRSLADEPGGGFYDTQLNFRNFQREEGYGASLRIDQQMGFADFTSITGFRDAEGRGFYDSDYSAQNFYNTDLNHFDRQFTQELQLKSKPASGVDWIVGLYYLRSRQGYDPARISGDLLTLVAARGAVQNIFSRQRINSYSAFGQATAPLGARTNLTVGLRYTRDEVDGSGRQTLVIPGVGTVRAAPDFNDSQTFKRLTWRGALDHRLSDDVLAYASISRGYKSGTFNTLPLTAAPARAEVVDAYEVGLKTDLADRRIRLNGALFWNDIRDPQVVTFLSQGVTAGVGLTNAEKARVRGAELSVEAIAAQGLRLRGAATFLDAKYRAFTDAPFYRLDGTRIVGPVRGDASGNRLPNVPRWRFDVGANYTVDAGPGEFVFDVNASYTSRFARNADNRIFQRAYTLVNASLNFTPASAEWLTLAAWGKNLTDVQYYNASQEFAGPLGIGGDIASAAPPLTFGGTAAVRF